MPNSLIALVAFLCVVLVFKFILGILTVASTIGAAVGVMGAAIYYDFKDGRFK